MFRGLSDAEVAQNRSLYGSNVIPTKELRLIALIGRQFKGIFNILLILASIVTWLLGEVTDAVLICTFVVLGIGLSVFQEYKSNAAAQKLSSYLTRRITVLRNGIELEIPVHETVVGDIIKLESGDIIPADAIVRHAVGLQVDETTFTGESIPVMKTAHQRGTTTDTEHLLLQGTIVIRGMALAQVTTIGEKTRLASIAKAASMIDTPSELTEGINKISTFMLRVTLVTLLFVILANLLIDQGNSDLPQLLIFAIALAVSVIPEALPLVMTFSLSRGAIRLAEEGVIVKRLSSVQDLGSINLICSDKTGTITENKLTYVNEYIIPESGFHPLMLARLAAHDLAKGNPEPFDVACDQGIDEAQRTIITQYTLIEEEAFDPALRSNGVRVKDAEGRVIHIRRGSPEYFFSQSLVSHERVGHWLYEEEVKGHRVLGVSIDEGAGPQFGGFVSFVDVLKPTTLETIQNAKALNVAMTIITGDSFLVARAIGRETGLVVDDSEVIEAGEFFALSTKDQHDRLTHIRVFARTTPEQKLALIELLKEKHTVGFLGEGINDAPALKAAHVSLVVQSASDVAKETADVILTKPDLRVIIDGIRLGRETHTNTLRYIKATLVSNFGNFYAVAIGSLFISFLPMLPKQLLLLNLLSDFPMMAIAFDRVSKNDIREPQRYDLRSLYIIFITLGLVSTIFDFMWFALFYQISPQVLQTNWFIASVLTEIVLLFSIRSMLPIEKSGWPAPILIALSAMAILSTILIVEIPFTANFFEFTTPDPKHLILIVSLVAVYFVTTELVKRPLGRFLRKTEIVS